MRDVFVLLVIFSVIPLVFLRPQVGILTWCWISYMNPHRLTWGLAYEFPVAMVVGLATLTAWALSKEPKKLQINALSGLLLAFVFWMSFANLFAMVPDLAFEKWNQSFKILLMTFITMALMQSRERLHAMIWVIVLSLSFYGLKGGVFTILGGAESKVWGPPRTFLADNNALAMALVMILPLVRYLQLHTQSRLIRMGLYIVMVTTMFSIIGSHSRGAFLGAGCMIAFLIWKSRRRVLLTGILVTMIAVAIPFVPQHWTDRMRTIETYEEDRSAQGRLEVWGFALKIAADRPLLGGGFRVSYNDNIYLRYVPDAIKGRGKNFHSVYFEILGELGFIGLAIYLAIIAAAWRAGSRLIKLTRHQADLHWANDLARMTQVSLVGFASAGAFQNLAFFDLYFHLIAILFLATTIVQRSLEAGTVAEPARAASAVDRPRFALQAAPDRTA